MRVRQQLLHLVHRDGGVRLLEANVLDLGCNRDCLEFLLVASFFGGSGNELQRDSFPTRCQTKISHVADTFLISAN